MHKQERFREGNSGLRNCIALIIIYFSNNLFQDSLTLIDAYKTGEQPPHDIAFDKWGSTVNLAVPSPKPGGVKRVTKKERPKQRVGYLPLF